MFSLDTMMAVVLPSFTHEPISAPYRKLVIFETHFIYGIHQYDYLSWYGPVSCMVHSINISPQAIMVILQFKMLWHMFIFCVICYYLSMNVLLQVH